MDPRNGYRTRSVSTSRIYKVEAIILKRRNVGETDRILTVFSKEYGKLRVIAKGIRRITSRRAPHLEIFNRATLLLYQGKSLDIVTEVMLLDGFQHIRNNLLLINAGYYACELVDVLLPERQEHRDVFETFKNHLHQLDSSKLYNQSEAFALSLLHSLGFLPPSRILSSTEIQPYIERIAERRFRSYHFLERS